MGNLNRITELVFASDNKACFIERERILTRLEAELRDDDGTDKYARILSKLLSEVSTPVQECDYFVGRAVEALPDEGMKAPSWLLYSNGHMSFDYAKVLAVGLKGILSDIEASAQRKGDRESLDFAKNSRIVVEAVRDFADRYAESAERAGKSEAARALRIVPFEPAYDFYSALQGMWILHMIASCYVGSRDYAFGRFDRYMLPFYRRALAEGKTREELTELLAGFMIKCNEICGRTAHNYRQKPVHCHSAKQYFNIGGEDSNEFSAVVLDAMKLFDLAQPQVIVMLDPVSDPEFADKTFEALAVLKSRMNIYNYRQIKQTLMSDDFSEEIARDFTYSACCTFDLNWHSIRMEHYTPVPQIFVKALHDAEYTDLEELLSAFKAELTADIQKFSNEIMAGKDPDTARREFVFDSLFLTDSAMECRYPCDGKAKYNTLNVFCPGTATIGDSLMILDKLVFREKRFTYAEFAAILKDDFRGHEDLRREILQTVRFGNDAEIDRYTVMAANAFLDAADAVHLFDNFYMAKSFYSLERDNSWSRQVGATPDGRKSGEPFSENQSPTYGADKCGLTALLKSVAKLPFGRTVAGGLNLTFSREMTPELLKALVTTYFEMGGIHVGISVVNAETLKDAMVNPRQYRSLTVRLYGFSEYFISLPEWQQLAILKRTEYEG